MEQMKNANVYREPETVLVPQTFVPENGQSWQRVAVSFFRRSRALEIART